MTIIVHRGGPKITKRIREVLDEPGFPVERTYQWAKSGKIRVFYIGPNIAAREDTLVEDLTGEREVAA